MRTPKLALNLDADAVTPPLRDFGIGEYSICDNDDFTIALMKKNKYINPKRTNEDFESIEAAGTCEAGTSADVSNSPLLPVFQTPGFKIASQKSPEKLSPEKKPSSTPEIPAFETPYFKKLIHVRNDSNCPETNFNEKELQDITGTGAKVKMYLFCLTELNRLSENWTPTYGSMYSLVLK
ncbi:SKA3 protein, partial [Polypterus senegalus]